MIAWKNYILPPQFKENVIKFGVEVFTTEVNGSSSTDNAGISTHSGSNESLWYYHLNKI